MAIVAAIGVVLLGPEEFKAMISRIYKTLRDSKSLLERYSNYLEKEFSESCHKEKSLVSYIIDSEGNLQKTYDVSEILPNIKK